MTAQPRHAPRLVLDDLSDFDPSEYSRFKYGDTTPAHRYAREIFDACLSDLEGTIDVVFSPNTYLPTAAHAIAEVLMSILYEEGLDTRKVNVDRKTTYTRDYGKMNAQERASMISGDTYAFRQQPRTGATLIFVDDVSITGTHQMILEQLMEREGHENPQRHVYYAVKRNPDIPASIESTLNQFAINHPSDTIRLMSEPGFVLNTRCAKRLLAHVDFSQWIHSIPSEILAMLHEGAVKNGYHAIEEYNRNFNLLEDVILSDSRVE